MDTDAPPAPTLDPAVLDQLRAELDTGGPLPAIDRLCDALKAAGDYSNLFYARLMRKRVELGVAPFPNSPASELPAHTHEPYEDAIRSAAREVGGLFLDRGDIPRAWPYFRMLNETEPVRAALSRLEPGPDDDLYPLIEVAWQQGLWPEKGFDLFLDRNGICSAITMIGQTDLGNSPDVRNYCVRRLVAALHDQLSDRLRGEIEARGTPVPAGATVTDLIAGRDDLFADDAYHIDTSHLSSVVQMAMQLPKCPELDLARELALYGSKLSQNLTGDNDPPFDDTYADYLVYLDVIAGRDADAGLAHFHRKAEAGMAEGYQFPAEVLVNLLLRVDRPKDALAAARQFLAEAHERQLSCPGVSELARKVGDFAAVSDTARAKGDPVGYLAGLIAGRA